MKKNIIFYMSLLSLFLLFEKENFAAEELYLAELVSVHLYKVELLREDNPWLSEKSYLHLWIRPLVKQMYNKKDEQNKLFDALLLQKNKEKSSFYEGFRLRKPSQADAYKFAKQNCDNTKRMRKNKTK